MHESEHRYFQYVKQELNNMPTGTKLAAYMISLMQIPYTYKMVDISLDGLLMLWQKSS